MKPTSVPNKIILAAYAQYTLVGFVLVFFLSPRYKWGLFFLYMFFGLLSYWLERKPNFNREKLLIPVRPALMMLGIFAPVTIGWWVLMQKSSSDQLPWLVVALVALALVTIIGSRVGRLKVNSAH